MSMNLLRVSRAHRCRAWWEAIKDLRTQRHAASFVHTGKGSRQEWEDIFCSVFGPAWRQIRDQCAQMSEWMALYPQFERSIVSMWGLPVCFTRRCEEIPDNPGVEPKRRRLALRALEDMPTSHGRSELSVKLPGQTSFAFFVDCKPLADVMAGRAPLRADGMGPIFERMTTRIFHLLDAKWHLTDPTDDPVVWVRRESNVIADYLANYTMDNRVDWAEKIQVDRVGRNLRDFNIICHSDGGTRGQSCSSAAWCVEALSWQSGTQTAITLAMGGLFLERPVSSFLAETLALDNCIQTVLEMIAESDEHFPICSSCH